MTIIRDYSWAQEIKRAEAAGDVAFAINLLKDGRIYVEFHGPTEVSAIEVDFEELTGMADMFNRSLPLIKEQLMDLGQIS